MTKTPIGIIGTGRMAATMTRALQTSAEFAPAAVLSGALPRATAFAQALDCGQAFDKEEEFLSSKIKAVYIANANGQHAALARAALMAGLPVLVEKPLTTTATQTEALCALAAERGVTLMENIWTLALPAYRALKSNLGPAAGTQRMTFDFSMPVAPAAMPGLFDPETGGAILDRAIYGLAYAQDLFGRVADVQTNLRRGDKSVDLGATLLLTHESGARSMITVALDMGGANSLSVSNGGRHLCLGSALGGEHLQIRDYFSPTSPPADGIYAEGRLAKLKAMPALRRLKARLGHGMGAYHGFGANMYHPILTAFAQALPSGGQSPLVPHDLSIAVARLITEARKG
ncbi:Gfo/Idh/MocA family oxidoreductase [Litorivita sp. NS0012-18]|uniref:Gfo/Idh/MocA family protein n=1 Tax=Litorivita sp. NS0012-18 TaxID=3127655 RepID=UPI00310BEB93